MNNGDPNINNWPTPRTSSGCAGPIPALRQLRPFLDINNDGIADKIVGIPATPNDRGPHGASSAGQQVFLGQADGTYLLTTGTSLEGVTQPIMRVEDINGDGCLDIGTDLTGYRDNQSWLVQNKTGTTCTTTFTATPRTALPYYPGFKHYSVDIDNSGAVHHEQLDQGHAPIRHRVLHRCCGVYVKVEGARVVR